MAILMIWDGSKEPPAFEMLHPCKTVAEAVQMADALAQSSPAKLYHVFDEKGCYQYGR